MRPSAFAAKPGKQPELALAPRIDCQREARTAWDNVSPCRRKLGTLELPGALFAASGGKNALAAPGLELSDGFFPARPGDFALCGARPGALPLDPTAL